MGAIGMSLRVLVGDDVADVRELVRVTLDLAGGFEVVGEACDGAEAVRLARTLQPDLVVLDVAMPVMDGLEAIGAIREVSPHSRIAVFSVLALDQLAQEVTDRGAHLCISKGVPASTLVDALRALGAEGAAPTDENGVYADRGPEGVAAASSPAADLIDPPEWTLAALEEANWGWEEAFDSAAAGMAIISTDGQLLRINREASRIMGRTPTELVGRRTREFVYPADIEIYDAAVARLTTGSSHVRVEVRILRPDGSAIWTAIRSAIVHGPDGRGAYVFGQILDIDRRRRAEQLFRVAFEHAPIGMAVLDGRGRFVSANPALGDLLGLAADDLPGLDAATVLRSDLIPGTKEVELHRCDGTCVWTSVSIVALEDDGPAAPRGWDESGASGLGDHGPGLIVQVLDVTERRAALAHLAHLAAHDPLTGLPNRTLLIRRAERAAAALRARDDDGRRGTGGGVAGEEHEHEHEHEQSHFALLFCDVDDFKEINDRFGHRIGDVVLTRIAARLRSAVRPTDTLVRHGGDEFVILLEGVSGHVGVTLAAERVLAAVGQPLEVEGISLLPGISVGVAISPSTGTADPTELIGQADAAMYRAKAAGGGWSY